MEAEGPPFGWHGFVHQGLVAPHEGAAVPTLSMEELGVLPPCSSEPFVEPWLSTGNGAPPQQNISGPGIAWSNLGPRRQPPTLEDTSASNPAGRARGELRLDRTQDAIGAARVQGLQKLVEPRLDRPFVIIDECDQFAGGRLDSGVPREGDVPLWLTDVYNRVWCVTRGTAGDGLCTSCRVVIDDNHFELPCRTQSLTRQRHEQALQLIRSAVRAYANRNVVVLTGHAEGLS